MPSSFSVTMLAVVALALSASALMPSTQLASVSSRAAVQMSTQYGDLSSIGFKKNKKTGDSSVLKGYTVGSRAPKASVSSGSKNQFGYGIGNLYGGGLADGSKKVVNEAPIKGKIQADSGGILGKLGTAWVGLVVLYVLTLIGGD